MLAVGSTMKYDWRFVAYATADDMDLAPLEKHIAGLMMSARLLHFVASTPCPHVS